MRKHFRNKLVKNVCLAMAILMVAFLGCQAYMNAGTTTSHNVIIVPKEYTGDKIVSMSATYISSAEPYVNREYKFEDVSVIATLENGETREMGYVQMDENSEELTEEYVVTKNNNQLVINLNPAIYDYEVSTTANLPVLVNVEAQLLNNQKQVDNAKYTYEDFSLTAVYSNGLSYAVPVERDMVQPYKTIDGQEVQAVDYIYADNIEVPVGEVKFDEKTYLEIELSMLDVTNYARMMGYYSSSNCCNLFNIEFSSTSNANIFPGRYALNVVDYKNRNLYTVSYAEQLVKVLDPDTRDLISVTQTNYTWTTEGQMFYLKGGGGCTWNGIGKIYGFKYVYDNATLMDLQPVKIDDNTYGLFNKVTSEIIFTMDANENHGGTKSDIHKMYDFEPKKLTGETTEITITLNPDYYGEGATATIPVNVLTIQSLDVELINTDEPYANKEYGYEDIAVTATLKNGETRQLGLVKLDENGEEIPEFLMTKNDGKITVNLNPDVFSYDVTGTLELPKLVNIEVEKLNTQKITPGAVFEPEDFKLTTVYDNGRSYIVPASNPYRLTDGTIVQPIEYIYADKIAVPVGEINFDSKTYLELDLEMLEASNYARMMGFYGGSSNCCNLFNIEFASYTSANVFPGRYALNVGDYRNRNLYTVSYADQMVKVLDPATRDLLYVTKTGYSWTTSNQMFYLKGGGDKTAYGTGKIYGFKYVYDNVTLMDLIPVKVDNETYGLYNIITSEMVFTTGANDNHGGLVTAGTEGNYSVSPYMISNDTTEIRFDLDSTLYGEGVYTTYPVEVVTIESVSAEMISTVPAYVGVEYDTNDFKVNLTYSDASTDVVDSNKYTISPSVIAEDTTEITITLLSEYFGSEITTTVPVTPLAASNVYMIGNPVANKVVAVLTDDKKMTIYGAGDIKSYTSTTSTDWYNERGSIENVEARGNLTPTNAKHLFSNLTSVVSITGLDNIDMTNTIDWSNMFYNDSKLAVLEGTETWNPKAMTTTVNMFLGCNSLPVVDLSSLDTSSLKDASNMMSRTGYGEYISSLTAAYARTQADADKLNGMHNICYTKWVAKPEGSNFMIGRIDGQLIWQNSIKSSITEIEVVNSIPEDLSSYTVYDLSVSSKEPVKAWIADTKMYIGANGIITSPTSMASFFRDFASLTKITGLDNIDMTNTTDWSNMFYNDSKLAVLEGTETWNPKAMTTTVNMFLGCNSLPVVDLSSLDTSSLKDASNMMSRTGYGEYISSLTAAYARTQADADKLNGMYNICYTKWTIKTITSFNLNGAEGTIPEPIVSPINKTLSLPVPGATKEGYDFVGWSIYKDNYSGSLGYTTSANNPNATLYAIWMPAGINYYNVTLNMNYEGSADSSIQVPQGYKIWDNLPVPTRTGYDFIGWYDAPTDGTMITTTWEPTEDTTIYAYWTPTVYTITYTLNSGSISEEARTTYTIEDEDFVLEIPTRSGYRFAGWNGSGYSYRTVTISKGSTGNKTYTANWQTAQAEGVLNDNVNFKAVLNEYKDSFTSVIFEESLPENIGEYTTIDFSYNYDNSVIGWIDDNQTLHIGSGKGKVVAYNTNGLFEGISYVERVDISKLDISNITNTQAIFKNMANLKYVNMSGLDFSKVTESSWMFYNDTKLETVEWDHDFTATKNLENLFRNCNNLTTSFYVAPTVTSYANALYGVSTSSGQLTLKFEETNKALTTNIYNTKSSSSNVVLEHVDNLYTITTDGSEYGYIDIPAEAYENVTLNLYNKSEGYLVTSYVMNGELVEGYEFTMPSENVTITDVKVVAASIIETAHNYSSNMNTTIGTWNFGSAEQVNISLKYQTEGMTDYFRLMNSDGTEYINSDGTTTTSAVSYGSYSLTQKEITTTVNSGQIFFHSDFSATYWGLRAVITPVGTDGNYYSIAVANNPGIHFNVSEESLAHAVPYKEIKLIPDETGYEVISFDLNGTTVEGNSFWMPMEDITIDNIVLNNFLTDYTTVEYVESDGNQEVDTGIPENEAYAIRLDFMPLPLTNTWQSYMGGKDEDFTIGSEKTTTAIYLRRRTALTTPISVSDTEKNLYVIESNGLSLGTTNNTIRIFGNATTPSRRSAMRFYYGEIKDSEGNLLRQLYPVIRNSDGAVGIVDLISGSFFASITETTLLPPSQASAETTSLFSIQNDEPIEDNTQLEYTGETEGSTTVVEGEGTGEDESLPPENTSPDTPNNAPIIPAEENTSTDTTPDDSTSEGEISENETATEDTGSAGVGEDIVAVEETPESESSAPLDTPNEDPVDLPGDDTESQEGETVSSEE